MSKKEKTSKLKSKIEELKKTPRGTAILKLIYWGIFFAFVFLVLIITSFINSKYIPTTPKPDSNNSNQSPEVTPKIDLILSTLTKTNLQNQIINGSYNYKYEITIQDTKYIFNGTKNQDIDRGYKETQDKVVKYYLDSTGIYEEKLNEKIPLPNLYENLDLNYLDKNLLFSTIQNLEFSLISSTDTLIYQATNSNIWEIAILHDTLKYIKITSQTPNEYTYYLEFNDIEV